MNRVASEYPNLCGRATAFATAWQVLALDRVFVRRTRQAGVDPSWAFTKMLRRFGLSMLDLQVGLDR